LKIIIEGKTDRNKDGFVKTNELANYVEDTMPELALKIFKPE
jgi:hypothetical protein